MNIKKGKHYHLNGAYFNDDDIVDFVTEIEVTDIEEDGTIWAMDKEGDEFEVLKEDLSEI